MRTEEGAFLRMAGHEEKNRTKGGLPTVRQALHAVAQDAAPGDRDIHRVSIRILASQEVTYRLHGRDEEFYEGGVVSLAE